MQINAPINKKNTGGAICNSKGELVGIADLTVTNEKNEIGKMREAITLHTLKCVNIFLPVILYKNIYIMNTTDNKKGLLVLV